MTKWGFGDLQTGKHVISVDVVLSSSLVLTSSSAAIRVSLFWVTSQVSSELIFCSERLPDLLIYVQSSLGECLVVRISWSCVPCGPGHVSHMSNLEILTFEEIELQRRMRGFLASRVDLDPCTGTAGHEGAVADISCMSIFSACFGLLTAPS